MKSDQNEPDHWKTFQHDGDVAVIELAASATTSISASFAVVHVVCPNRALRSKIAEILASSLNRYCTPAK